MSTAAQIRHTFTSSWLNVLLIAAPVSWWLALEPAGPRCGFSWPRRVSLVPAAGLIGAATDQLAERAGPTLGGFLNATFGNAAELIIAIAALRAHHTAVVKASITGSIIGNLLLVFGLSCVVGGFRTDRRSSIGRRPGTATVMLFLAAVALVMPAVGGSA